MLPLLTLFSLPEDIVSSTTAYIGDMFTDLGLLIYLAIGIPLAFFVIKKVISIMPKR